MISDIMWCSEVRDRSISVSGKRLALVILRAVTNHALEYYLVTGLAYFRVGVQDDCRTDGQTAPNVL
jgi:hypothetical protein